MYFQETTEIKNKSLEELLLPLVEKAINGVEKGADFIVEQAPIIVQQFLTFKTFECGFYLLVSIILMFTYRFALPLFTTKEKPDDVFKYLKLSGRFIVTGNYDLSPHQVCLTAITVIGSFIGITIFFRTIIKFVKILVAPNLYLLEYFIDKV